MKIVDWFFSVEKYIAILLYFIVVVCGLSFLIPGSKELVLVVGEMAPLILISLIFWMQLQQNSTKSLKIWIMLNFTVAFLVFLVISKNNLILNNLSFSRFFRFQIVGIPLVLVLAWLTTALTSIKIAEIISKIKLFKNILASLILFLLTLFSSFYLVLIKFVVLNSDSFQYLVLLPFLILAIFGVLSYRWLKVDSPITMFLHYGVVQLLLMLSFIGLNL
jgi:hypothetical protein